MKTYHIWEWRDGRWEDMGPYGHNLHQINFSAEVLGDITSATCIPVLAGDDPNNWEISKELDTSEKAESFAKAHREWIYAGCHSNHEVVWDQKNGGYKIEVLNDNPWL
jgi:hypothetical protein